jgi:hypothetical protein
VIEPQMTLNLRSRSSLLPGGCRAASPMPSFKGLVLLISLMLLVLTGCVPAPSSVAVQLVEAVNAQKLNTALSFFSDNAVVSVEGLAPFSGRPEITAWLERLTADKIKLTTSEILKQDEKSFSARYSLTMASANDLGVASLEGTGEITTRMGLINTLSFSLSPSSRDELRIASLHKGLPLLSYAVLTDPEPLRASPGGAYGANLASLTLSITNGTGKQVLVRSIAFRIPQGAAAGDLTPNISGVNSEAPDRWHLTNKEGRFTLAPELPEDGALDAGQGLSITLSRIEISDKPGACSLEIFEETGTATTGAMAIQLAKSPFALIVSDLIADPLVIAPGESTVLYWVGSDGATYKLYDGHTFIDVNSTDSYTVRDLKKTTTFYLTAALVGGEDLPPAVIRERTVTVTSP